MEIFPVINCGTESCFNDRLRITKMLPLKERKIVHIDVSDGVFAASDTWITPAEMRSVIENNSDLEFAVHLMIDRPEDMLGVWLATGVKEIVIHCERLNDAGYVTSACRDAGVTATLGVNPETSSEFALRFKEQFTNFLLLAVKPGPAGQPMRSEVIPKIGELRTALPDATIGIDGGVTPSTVRLIREASVDYVVAGTYIFIDMDPAAAYRRLVEAAERI